MLSPSLAGVDEPEPLPASRWSALLARAHPGGLVYGAIITGTLLVAVSGHESSAGRVVLVWVLVLGTYWLAHVFVHAAESQFQGDNRSIIRRSLVAARAEVAVLEGGIPAMVVFLIASWVGLGSLGAEQWALWSIVGFLAAVAYIGTRHAGRSHTAAVGEAIGASLLGLILVLAKTLLH